MEPVVERLMRYAKIYTESDPDGSPVNPSAQREFDLAHLLVEELHALGLTDAAVDEHCYVYAHLDADPGLEQLPAVGLIAHMDTAPDMTGKNVRPQIIHYEGGDVVLNREQNIVMKSADFPDLAKYVGQDLVCSDGTTLLGCDDKGGIAIILQALEELIAEQIPHGKICVAFTPDEEIGRGSDSFDIPRFGADFAYTVDGGDITNFEYETFNAASADVTVHGFSIHPGDAKDRMKNALTMAMEFNALLPPLETPEHTEGYQGFFHLHTMEGTVEETRMQYIIRDHSMDRFRERKELILRAADVMNTRWGCGAVTVEVKDQYYNMYEILKDHMEVVRLAEAAMMAAGVDHPTHAPVRGGTDGCMLTYKGLLCPNLPTGGHNFHGRYEFVPVPSLLIGVRVVKNLLSRKLLEEIVPNP